MSLVFTMPGKKGDALHQWPVAYWYCRQNNTTCDLWLDEKELPPLKRLFESQPCVDNVILKPGIKSYEMGGQPWDFGLKTIDHVEHEIYHLGFRRFPVRQITLEALDMVPLRIERPENEKSLLVKVNASAGTRCVLHGNFASHTSGVPGFWRFLASVMPTLMDHFDDIVFVGTSRERERANEIWPLCKTFDDQGDFLNLAELIAGASLMIGCGSSNIVLAGLLGVPAVRVHDPIGEYSKVIWSNLGENQLNATELELRTEWPEFWKRWFSAAEVT